MSSKKSKTKSERKPNRYEIAGIVVMALLIILIAIVAIFNQRQSRIRLYFVAVETISIDYDWVGLSDIAPSYSYQLNFLDGRLTGTANFSIGHEDYEENDVPIEIPADVTQKFFGKLKEIQLLKGQYEPLIEHTDDYPSMRITIDTRREIIKLYSQSQGEDRIPWGAYMRDTEYIIDSGIPAEALAILDPYLKKDILDGLIADYRANR